MGFCVTFLSSPSPLPGAEEEEKLNEIKYRAAKIAKNSRAFDGVAQRVIQAPKPEPRIMRYELTDFDWAAIKPFLPNKQRGVPRVNHPRSLNGMCCGFPQGAPAP